MFRLTTMVYLIGKVALYYFQITLFVPDIFKFLKYINKLSDDVINSTKF